MEIFSSGLNSGICSELLLMNKIYQTLRVVAAAAILDVSISDLYHDGIIICQTTVSSKII